MISAMQGLNEPVVGTLLTDREISGLELGGRLTNVY
jgi:hypothetical protein